ncbi:MAG TPA: sugar ABC transporter permease, partial [Anaerolineae bacterium]|nr:sugar ABC transporter permease [Anaerolineae bacterium]
MKRSTFFAFMAPSLISMLVLMIVPLVMAIWLGFQSFSYWTMDTPRFVWLQNYQDILADSKFWEAVKFTFSIIAIVTPTEMLIGFIIALLLDQVPKRKRGIYIALCLTTYVSVPIVASYMFRGLFQPGGLGSWSFEQITSHRLILNETTIKSLIMVYGVWRDTPFVVILVFAGLQSLSSELLEAAAIDGANRWQQLRYVTLPHLAPLLLLIAMIVIMALFSV